MYFLSLLLLYYIFLQNYYNKFISPPILKILLRKIQMEKYTLIFLFIHLIILLHFCKYIAFQFIAILGADECLLPVGAPVLFPTNYYLSIPFFENFFHLTFFV